MTFASAVWFVLSGGPVHRHVPDGPCQQHHHLSGAKCLPHPAFHQAEAVRQSRRSADPRQRLEDVGPQTQPGQVSETYSNEVWSYFICSIKKENNVLMEKKCFYL